MAFKYIRLALAAACAAFIFSCVSAPPAKTTETVLTTKVIPVEETEVPQWQAMIKGGKSSDERSKGAFWTGQYYFNKKDYPAASKYFEYNLKYYIDTDWGYLSAVRMADIYLEQKDNDRALDTIKVLYEKRLQFAAFKQAASSRLLELLKSVDLAEAERLYSLHVHRFVDEEILYYLCKTALAENDFDRFFRHAGSFLFQFRDSAYYEEILAKFRESSKYKPVSARSFGVILPLTGKSMDVGKLIKNAVELALAEYNEGKDDERRVGVIYIDEADEKLEEKVVKIIEEQNVIAFLGPVYSKTVKQLMPVMEQYNTAMFSPTAAQPDLVSDRGFFFRNCGTAAGQAAAMAKYIMSDTAYRRLCTMYSLDAYGRNLNEAFTSRFAALGGEVVKQAGFDPAASDFRQQIVALGGIDAMLLKSKRAEEAMALSDEIEKAGKRIQRRIFDYLNLFMDEVSEPLDPKKAKFIKPVVSVALLKFTPLGKNTKKYLLDDEMTKKLSYTIAKDPRIKVLKQSQSDSAMADIGVSPEDLDRELALSVAGQLKADMLVWGRIVEAESDTIYANFVPEEEVDAKGVTKFSYSFTDSDYFRFKVSVSVFSVADEAVVDQIDFEYRKIKEPRFNPMSIDAVYIPAVDRKMVLIRDQLKFYDFDLPVFASSSMASPYITSFMESVDGVVYPAEFYADDQAEAMQDFMKKYREKYGVNPDVIAANSFDAMSIMCAMAGSNIDSRENFRKVLSGVRNYEGATGTFSFDKFGDSVRDYYIMQIKNGETRLIKKVKGE